MKIKRYDMAHVAAVLLVPPVLLSEGFYIYSFIAFVVSMLLIMFGPIFTALMRKTTSAVWFVIVSLSSGMISAAINQYEPDMGWLFVVWTFSYCIYYGIILITIGIIDSEKTNE